LTDTEGAGEEWMGVSFAAGARSSSGALLQAARVARRNDAIQSGWDMAG
jgi:hypothetical protein